MFPTTLVVDRNLRHSSTLEVVLGGPGLCTCCNSSPKCYHKHASCLSMANHARPVMTLRYTWHCVRSCEQTRITKHQQPEPSRSLCIALHLVPAERVRCSESRQLPAHQPKRRSGSADSAERIRQKKRAQMSPESKPLSRRQCYRILQNPCDHFSFIFHKKATSKNYEPADLWIGC